MRSPEVARALTGLVADGVLAPEKAAPLVAVARGELVSIRAELRALLGLAVTLATAGVGLWIKAHPDLLGPVPVALLLGAAAAGATLFAARRSSAFTWGRDPERDWIVDGLVLLAAGLVGAELAWIERQFGALGASWPLHLLAVSLATGALAVRFDSLAAWSLALATFAAWRGVGWGADLGGLERSLDGRANELRFEWLACGALFFALARLAERFGRKAHFEPATTVLAFLAAVTGLASGLGEATWWPLWALSLGGLGVGAAAWAFVRRRRGLLALGALAAYVALTRALFALPGIGSFGCFWFFGSTVAAIALLVVVERRFRALDRDRDGVGDGRR